MKYEYEDYDKKIDEWLEIEEAYQQSYEAYKKLVQAKGDDYQYSDKTAFLDELFENYNIIYVTKDPRTFFSKLIKLYGEEFLADYRYTIYGQDIDEHGNIYTYVVDMLAIQDFLMGKEDVLDLVTSDKLRNAILGIETQLTPLQQKEAELSSLEAEAKTISEAEKLIDKQTKKEGQGIGE